MSGEWNLGVALSSPPFSRLEIVDELYSVGDDPWIFTFADGAESRQYLGYLVEEVLLAQPSTLARRFIVAPAINSKVEALKDGRLSVFEALTDSWMWVSDVFPSGEVHAVYTVEAHQLPEDALPGPSVMLWASLEPALSLRYVGTHIWPGRTPAAVFERAGAAAADALGKLAVYAAGDKAADQGRRPEWLRAIYNLPVQRVAYGSLEVHFRMPTPPAASQTTLGFGDEHTTSAAEPERVASEAWRMLQSGLRWLNVREGDGSEADGEFAGFDDHQRLVILEALKALAPSTPGVDEVTVSGQLVLGPSGAGAYTLRRDDARAVRDSLRRVKSRLNRPTVFRVFTGLIRDLDLDRRFFILRKPDALDSPGHSFVLDDDDLLEVARDAYGDMPVTVVGRSASRPNDPWIATEIEETDTASEDDQ